MSRELELRATRKDTGETFELLCIDWMHSCVFLAGHMVEVDIDSVVIEQFTGLFDSNGKKIFEGDKVKNVIGVGVVEYHKESAGFTINYSSGEFYHPITSSTVIIGNIHEAKL